MSCSSCKNKAESRYDEFEKQFSGINKAAMGFVIIWSGLAIFGLYSLIKLFL